MEEKDRLTPASASSLYAEVQLLADNRRMERKDRLVRLRQVLEDVLQEAVQGDPACPSADLFQRSVYVLQRAGCSKRLQGRVQALREAANRSAHDSQFVPTETQERHGVGALCELISALSGVPVPAALQSWCSMEEEALEQAPQTGSCVDEVRALVLDFGEPSQGISAKSRPLWYRAVHCILDRPDAGSETTLLLLGDWSHTQLWPYATLTATACRRAVDGRLSTTGRSLVTLEPDMLVDATVLAECFAPGPEKPNPRLPLVLRYRPRGTNWQALAGIIAGGLFDSLAAGVPVDPPAFIEEQLRAQVLSLLVMSDDDIDLARRNVLSHVGGIRTVAEQVRNGGKVALEPILASSRYGLEGRLDALVEGSGTRSFRVVELKNGAVPHASPEEVRPAHAAQAWCYELLVQSALGAPPQTADVVYLADEASPWRPAASRREDRIRLLQTRNEALALDRAAAFGADTSVLQHLLKGDFGPTGPFDSKVLGPLSEALTGAAALERAYFLAFSAFLGRERWTASLGTGDDSGHGAGHAGLWLLDLAQKEERCAVLPFLRITGRDPASGEVQFAQEPGHESGGSFREGDGVVLYRQEDGADPLRGPLFRGTITGIDHRAGTASVALYNRCAVLDHQVLWALEEEGASGNLQHAQYAALLQFLQAPARRRALLLGTERPRAGDLASLQLQPRRDLTPHQRELLGRALAAQDYFLVQGPPGSGKTQMMLVEMVRQLLRATDGVLLLMAYTNRAVGEMCRALEADEDAALHEYLLFGRDAGLDERAQAHAFGAHAAEHGYAAARELAGRSRIFVATAAMCTQHPEILQTLRQRGVPITAIVDEAAQLLEPQVIGPLSQVDRFILIGDERQLPAVVQQAAPLAAATDQQLREAGFRDLRMSLFERLLRRCQEQGWTQAFGMLTDQARMHGEIVAFANRRFYGGRLSPREEWQSSTDLPFRPAPGDPLEQALAQHRVLFIPSAPPRTVARFHAQEAARVARLVRAFTAAYRRQDPVFDPVEQIGIITPFRAQAACICRQLPEQLQELTVDTVERYQGGERDIIIVSLAVHAAAQMPSIMALSWDGTVDRKLNVMLTRARRHLVLLGDPGVLLTSPLPDGSVSFYPDLLQELRDRGAWLAEPDRLLGA